MSFIFTSKVYFVLRRRDKGFSYVKYPNLDHLSQALQEHGVIQPPETTETVCDGSLFLCYILPPLIHLCAFVQTIYLLRITENEHLQTLFEKVSRYCFACPSSKTRIDLNSL